MIFMVDAGKRRVSDGGGISKEIKFGERGV